MDEYVISERENLLKFNSRVGTIEENMSEFPHLVTESTQIETQKGRNIKLKKNQTGIQ